MATMADGKLTGQVALITGASSGIGWAIARAFLKEGADLVVVARRPERLQALAGEAQKSGRRCAVVLGDVREEETAVRAVQTATQQLGQLDILVNNAGIGRYADLIQTSADDYDAMMDTNMRSCIRYAGGRRCCRRRSAHGHPAPALAHHRDSHASHGRATLRP